MAGYNQELATQILQEEQEQRKQQRKLLKEHRREEMEKELKRQAEENQPNQLPGMTRAEYRKYNKEQEKLLRQKRKEEVAEFYRMINGTPLDTDTNEFSTLGESSNKATSSDYKDNRR